VGASAGRLLLRLFIDGIEVPVLGARTSNGVNSPASAAIRVVPTREVWDLKPRSLVELYVYEDDPLGHDPIDQPDGHKLAFAGELIGLSMSKSASERHVSIEAVDTTNYWDSIRQHYVNFSNGGIELFENAFYGVDSTQVQNFDVTGTGAESNLFKWLRESTAKDLEGNEVPSFYAGVHRVLREMFFSGSEFYVSAYNRMRVGDTLVGVPGDSTAQELWKLQYFIKFLKNRVGGQGADVTARMMIETLLAPVFHTYVSIPFPMFDEEGRSRGISVEEMRSTGSNMKVGEHVGYPRATLNYTVIKPDAWFLAPPVCNVMFPEHVNSVTFQRNYLAEPTRLFLRTSTIFGGQDAWLTERFYAPNADAFAPLANPTGRSANYLRRMSKVLLPHEQFTGPLPVSTWQDDIAAYVQKGARRQYMAKVADYTFWKMRFSGRTSDVVSKLNLDIVPGLPGVVLDESGHHIVGNVAAVAHDIDASTGGRTLVTLQGAYRYDETADVGDGVIPLETIAVKGEDGATKGFLDDRYVPDRIGPDVYQPLFGCDSVIEYTPEGADTSAGQVPAAIDGLWEEYKAARRAGVPLHEYTKRITHRPKANLRQMHGDEDTPGFFDAAINPDSPVHENMSWTFTETQETYREVPMGTYRAIERLQGLGYEREEAIRVAQGTGMSLPHPEGIEESEDNTVSLLASTTERHVTVSLDLKAKAEERQAAVQAYVDSLASQGIRG
jgi:hypothetical protein